MRNVRAGRCIRTCRLFFFRCDPAATRTQDLEFRRLSLYPAELQGLWSGHPDSNWGSPAPKAGAITGLRYIPLVSKKGASLGASLWRRRGDSNPRYPNRVRQFSKLLVSATHPPLRVFDLAKKHRFLSLSKSGAKLQTFFQLAKYFLLLLSAKGLSYGLLLLVCRHLCCQFIERIITPFRTLTPCFLTTIPYHLPLFLWLSAKPSLPYR